MSRVAGAVDPRPVRAVAGRDRELARVSGGSVEEIDLELTEDDWSIRTGRGKASDGSDEADFGLAASRIPSWSMYAEQQKEEKSADLRTSGSKRNLADGMRTSGRARSSHAIIRRLMRAREGTSFTIPDTLINHPPTHRSVLRVRPHYSTSTRTWWSFFPHRLARAGGQTGLSTRRLPATRAMRAHTG